MNYLDNFHERWFDEDGDVALCALGPGLPQLGHGVVPVDGVAVALAEVQLLVAGERGLLEGRTFLQRVYSLWHSGVPM